MKQYYTRKYNHKVRWMNFWHQIDEILKLEPNTVLEIGKGGGVVSDHLKKSDIQVTTCDINPDTKPDIVASVTNLPLDDKKYDVVLIAEVLEHLPFKEVNKALSELNRVTKKYVLVTLPYRGTFFSFLLKIPKIPKMVLFVPFPYFWKKHAVTPSGHYWEIGKRGFSRKKIRKIFKECGFSVPMEKIFADDYDHIFFVLQIRDI